MRQQIVERSKIIGSTRAALLVSVLALAAHAEGGDGGGMANADEAARKSSNPLGGDFFIFLNQIDNFFMEGDATRGKSSSKNLSTWSMQPVLPFPMKDLIGDDWIFVTRPTLPFVMNAEIPNPGSLGAGGAPVIPPANKPPGANDGLPFSDKSGFGDIAWFSLLGQSIPTEAAGGGDLVWGVGPTFQFPTASSDSLGGGKFSAGPAAVASFIGKRFILGGLLQHWESYASGGKGLDSQVSFSWFNLFYFWNLSGGWQVGGTPIMTADWESDDSSQRFTVPIGLGVYKTTIFGKLPMKLGVEMQYFPIRPDLYGPEFNIRIVIAPIIPSPFGSLGK